VPPEYEGYIQALRRRIQDRLAYPWLAARRGVSGTVELEIRLDAEGRLTEASVLGTPPPASLGEAAVRAVREATPLPFPPGVPARPLTVRLPVVFELR
jgi:protein TonB